MKSITLLIVAVVISGCTSFTSPARKHDLADGGYWMDYDASRRGTLVLKRGSSDQGWVVCSEPAPDVAMNLVNKLEGDLTAGDLEVANAKGEITVSAIKLAERTQMVSFLRESLFRLCEMSVSREFTSAESKDMYLKVLDTALTMVQKDKAEVEQETAKAQASVEQAKAINTLLNKGVDLDALGPLLNQ